MCTGSMAEGIQDEEQFQSLIKAELWYDSEEESDSENGGEFDYPDTGSAVGTTSHEEGKQEVLYVNLFMQVYL